MNLRKTIKVAFGNLVLQIYKFTSKHSVMKLSEFYDTPVMTKYHHIVTALRYVAVEEHFGENDFGKALYAKANRLQNVQQDFARFQTLIGSIETKGYDMRCGIYVDLDRNCFNGTHRLALCVWFGVAEIPVYMVKRHLKQPSVQDMKAYYRLSDQDYEQLEQAYRRMRERIQKNNAQR